MRHKFYDEKIYLVTYPKSGTVWLRNIVYEMAVDLPIQRNIEDAIPSVSDFNRAPNCIVESKNPQILHTHDKCSELPEDSIKIYLVRNPVDVAISFWHFFPHHSHKPFSEFLTYFLSENDRFYGSWKSHLEDAMSCKNVYFITYEDLHSDFENEIIKLKSILKINRFGKKSIAQLKNNCSFENMKLNKDKFDAINSHMGEHFRVGKANEYDDEFFKGDYAPLKDWYLFYKNVTKSFN